MTRAIIVSTTLISFLFTSGCDTPWASMQRNLHRDDTSNIPDVRRKPPCGPKVDADPWEGNATKCIVIVGADE